MLWRSFLQVFVLQTVLLAIVALPLIAVNGNPIGGWWALIDPVTITYWILHVSGVPMLESKMAVDPKYADYLRSTNRFFPGKPRTHP